MKTKDMLEQEGYTDRVLIHGSFGHPFQAVIKPDTYTGDMFVAWIVDRKVFDIIDGKYFTTDPIH